MSDDQREAEHVILRGERDGICFEILLGGIIRIIKDGTVIQKGPREWFQSAYRHDGMPSSAVPEALPIPTSERLPEYQQNVLLWLVTVDPKNSGWVLGQRSSHEEGKFWDGERYRPMQWITHWKPLPAAPSIPSPRGTISPDPAIMASADAYASRLERALEEAANYCEGWGEPHCKAIADGIRALKRSPPQGERSNG